MNDAYAPNNAVVEAAFQKVLDLRGPAAELTRNAAVELRRFYYLVHGVPDAANGDDLQALPLAHPTRDLIPGAETTMLRMGVARWCMEWAQSPSVDVDALDVVFAVLDASLRRLTKRRAKAARESGLLDLFPPVPLDEEPRPRGVFLIRAFRAMARPSAMDSPKTDGLWSRTFWGLSALGSLAAADYKVFPLGYLYLDDVGFAPTLLYETTAETTSAAAASAFGAAMRFLKRVYRRLQVKGQLANLAQAPGIEVVRADARFLVQALCDWVPARPAITERAIVSALEALRCVTDAGSLNDQESDDLSHDVFLSAVRDAGIALFDGLLRDPRCVRAVERQAAFADTEWLYAYARWLPPRYAAQVEHLRIIERCGDAHARYIADLERKDHLAADTAPAALLPFDAPWASLASGLMRVMATDAPSWPTRLLDLRGLVTPLSERLVLRAGDWTGRLGAALGRVAQTSLGALSVLASGAFQQRAVQWIRMPPDARESTRKYLEAVFAQLRALPWPPLAQRLSAVRGAAAANAPRITRPFPETDREVIIQGTDGSVRMPIMLLAAASGVFSARLRDQWTPEDGGDVLIDESEDPAFTLASLRDLRRFIFAGQCSPSDNTVVALLRFSDMYGILRLRAVCEEYIATRAPDWDLELMADVALYPSPIIRGLVFWRLLKEYDDLESVIKATAGIAGLSDAVPLSEPM